ncbi:MAG: septation ring formation regulator EzrA [Turicibacter sp.]
MGDYKLLLLFVIVGILFAILLYSIIIVSKKKQYFTKIDELDYFKHEISNKTVPFELAKLRSTKKSERIVKLVQQWEHRWGALETQFISVTEQIIYAEELVEKRQFLEVDEILEETHGVLVGLNKEVESLLDEIKSLKRSEERSRSNVVGLKEQFEQLKTQYDVEKTNYTNLHTEIIDLFQDIERLFLKFNEYMEECNYDLADETILTIKTDMEKLNIVFERVPMYFETIEKNIKPLLDDVIKSCKNLSGSGVYLDHLQIETVIGEYRSQLADIEHLVKKFEFAKLESVLVEMEANAKQMLSYMKNEFEIKSGLQKGMVSTKEVIQKLSMSSLHLNQRYENIKSNYTLTEEEENNFRFLLNEIQIVSNEMNFFVTRFEENKTPNSEMNYELEQLNNQIKEIEQQLILFESDIERLYEGEKECRQVALLVLQRFNDLKARHNLMSYPIEDMMIKQLISEGNLAIKSLFDEIDKVPINIADIDEQLAHAQQVIHNIINVVDKEIQQLRLAEQLIVYGHRYIAREGMYVVDLTIAEDQFRQGNYSMVVDKMKKILKAIEGSHFDLTLDQFKQSLDCYLL